MGPGVSSFTANEPWDNQGFRSMQPSRRCGNGEPARFNETQIWSWPASYLVSSDDLLASAGKEGIATDKTARPSCRRRRRFCCS
jgi:hypothetical protein